MNSTRDHIFPPQAWKPAKNSYNLHTPQKLSLLEVPIHSPSDFPHTENKNTGLWHKQSNYHTLGLDDSFLGVLKQFTEN